MLSGLDRYIPKKPLSYIVILLVLALGVSLFIYSPFAPIFIISICFSYAYLGRKFSSTYVDSKLLLFMLTLFTHTALFGLLVITCSAISNVSLHVVLCIELLTFALLFGYEAILSPDKHRVARKTLSASDVAALAIAIVAFLLMSAVPLLNLSVQKQHSNVLALVTGNVDYGAHLAMFNDYLDFGTVRTWDNRQPARSDTGGFYPSSWHAANATIAKVSAPSLKPGASSAVALGISNVFWLSVLVFLSVRLAFTLYDLLGRDRKKSPSVYVVMLSLSLAAIYFFTIHIQRFGFFSFTPQLIAVLLLIYTLHQLLHEGPGKASALGLAVLYCSISLAAWILLLPAVGTAVVIAVAMTTSRKRLGRTNILWEIQSNWPLYLIATASVMAQFWLILTVRSAATVTPGKGLLLDGGTPIYNPILYELLFAGLIAAVVMCKKHKDTKPYEPVFIITTATLLFTCLLFAFQTYSTGAVHYYYLKSLLLLPAVLTPLAIAVTGVFVYRIKDTLVALMVAILIPIAIVQLVPSDTGIVSFIHGSRIVPSSINSDIWTEMHDNFYPTKRVTMYFMNSGTNETSTIAAILVQASRPHNQCFDTLNNDITFMALDAALKKLTTNPLPNSCRGYHVVFKVDPSYAHIVKGAPASKHYDTEFVHG